MIILPTVYENALKLYDWLLCETTNHVMQINFVETWPNILVL